MPVSSYELAKQQMAQRLSGRGVSPSGLRSPMGSPPPSSVGQQPLGAAPTAGAPTMGAGQARITPLLEQVFAILVQGDPADLQAFGEFMARLQDMVQRHQGQGAAQTAPTAPAATPPVA